MLEKLNVFIAVATLIVAAYFDIKYRKIPNLLTIPVVLWGFLASVIFSGFYELIYSFIGFLVGLAIFLLPFSMGGMGAGDVKLMAAIGSLIGWKLTVFSALLTAIAGGIIVIGYTVYKGYFIKVLKKIGIGIYKKILYFAYLSTHDEKIMKKYKETIEVSSTFEKTYIPYGVAIAIGTLIVLIGNHLGYPPFV